MADKNPKIVKIQESKLINLINDLVEEAIVERNLIPAESKPKTNKVTVTESQLKELQKKGIKISNITKKKS
jgi:hypothetical protein